MMDIENNEFKEDSDNYNSKFLLGIIIVTFIISITTIVIVLELTPAS